MPMTHEEEEVLGFVHEWYRLAVGSEDLPDNAYFRFVAIWIAFNGLCAVHDPNAQTDRAQLNSFGNWSRARTAHSSALHDERYGAAVAVLASGAGVWNFQTDKAEVIDDPKNLQQIIDAVYRVRCNLFHARKVPANLRDVGLVEAAHVIVAELVGRLVGAGDAVP